jgi:signal transduction histidine kinase
MADRQPAGEPDSVARDDAQIAELATRAAASEFLRWRPLVVAPVALANVIMFAISGAEPARVRGLAAGLALMTTAFVLESLALRRYELSARWLGISLLSTTIGIGVGMAMTGGVESPMLPLLFAPSVTALAAFGRSHMAVYPTAATLIVIVLGTSFPPLGAAPAAPWAARMTMVAMIGSLVLLVLSVTGVFAAFTRSAFALEQLRRHSLAEARQRTEHIELVGAKVAHELKNPLAAIKGLIQLLAKQPQSERDTTRLAVIESELERIEGTLASYLSFTRPLTDLKLERVDLGRLLDEIAVGIEGRAAGAGVRVTRRGSLPPFRADARRLREGLLNLASNAIEASPAGGGVEIVGEALPSGGVRLIVEDEGLGFSGDPLKPFDSEKPGGSGLGLLIAKSAAELHGGSLEMTTNHGRGTRAIIELPAPPLEGDE